MRPRFSFKTFFSGLSLDVVIGAMAGMYFFQRLFHVQLEASVFGLLGLAVWVLYTVDHLMDAKRAIAPLSERRELHLKYGLSLHILVLLVSAVGLVLAWNTLGWGTELQLILALAGAMVGSRWVIQQAGPVWMKEISIALFYVLGIVWIPFLRAAGLDLPWQSLLFVPLFFLLALLNLWMLSFLDRSEDHSSGFVSIATLLPAAQLLKQIRSLAFLGIFAALGAFILLPSFYRPFSCLVLFMFLLHYLTFFQTRASAAKKRQRMELAFWIPWLLFLI